MFGNTLYADLISGVCPESISEHPRLVFSSWPWAAGNIRFVLEPFFRRNPPPVSPLELSPRAKSYFRWFSTYNCFPQKRTRHVLLMDFSISLLQPSSYLQKFTKNLFFILSLHWFILNRLCSRQVPYVESTPIAYILDFPTFPEPGESELRARGNRLTSDRGNRPGRVPSPAPKEAE